MTQSIYMTAPELKAKKGAVGVLRQVYGKVFSEQFSVFSSRQVKA
jgi:hypothetical protein